MKIEYCFTKKKNEYINSLDAFKGMFSIHSEIRFEDGAKRNKHPDNQMGGKLYFREFSFEYNLSLVEIKNSSEIMFHMVVENKFTDYWSITHKQIEALEELNSVILELNEQHKNIFKVNTIWNDVSMYYGRTLYPSIVNLENTLRKIIYLFMQKTAGSDWYEKNTSFKFQNKVNEIIKKNSMEDAEITDWLTFADFITLGDFFDTSYALEPNVNLLFGELKDVKELSNEKIEELKKKYKLENNWNRYFGDKLPDLSRGGFRKKWRTLYNIRNMVAHSKPIIKSDFEKACQIITELQKAFDDCLNIIDDIKVSEEQSEAIKLAANRTIEYLIEIADNENSEKRMRERAFKYYDYIYKIRDDGSEEQDLKEDEDNEENK